MPENEPHDFINHGDGPDHTAQVALHLINKVVYSATEFTKGHKKFIGTMAVISVTASIVASFAINKFLGDRPGATEDEIIAGVDDKYLIDAEKEMAKASRLQRATKAISRTLNPNSH